MNDQSAHHAQIGADSTRPQSEIPLTDFVDQLDIEVYRETVTIRRMYEQACRNLGQQPRSLSPIIIGMRSVTP